MQEWLIRTITLNGLTTGLKLNLSHVENTTKLLLEEHMGAELIKEEEII
jgi:hypothetical protein